MDNKKQVEAILFAVGKAITTKRISSLTSLSEKEVEEQMQILLKEYSTRETLHIVNRDNTWKLTVRDEFIPLVSSIVSSTELDRPLMETLAVIAWRYPVVQSEIVKLRGPSAYDHMRSLIEQGFVAKERFGRTYKVKLTKKFFGYFDLPSEEAKQAFLNKVPKEVLDEAENVNKEIDEVQRLSAEAEKEALVQNEISSAMKDVKTD
jgi:segregation and condensation protein B